MRAIISVSPTKQADGGDAWWLPKEAENSAAMAARGLWGVPSFTYGKDWSAWGQDRLRALEMAVREDVGLAPL